MFVSVLMVRILVDECRVRGIAADALLAHSDVCSRADPRASALTREQLADVNTRVPDDVFADLAQRALRLTGDEGLGLALGAHMPGQALQAVGYLLSSAPTLRHAYRDFDRYASILAEHPRWNMREEGERAHFEFSCPIREPATLRMANDWSVSLAHRLIAETVPGAQRSAMSVALSHAKPKYAERYAALLQCDVRFAQRRNAVIFPRAWLDLPQPHGDAATCDSLREMAERMLAAVSSKKGLGDRIRVLLRQEQQLSAINVANLARKLGLSQSALRRKLAAEGLSPSRLLEEAMERRACAELLRVDASIKQVADALGYAELRSFHRAFKRWTGQTPGHYRASALA
jgi:AraC-like DNA-binding protein